jgi:hypothetical protein
VLIAQLLEAAREYVTLIPLLGHGSQVHEKRYRRVVFGRFLRVDRAAHPLPGRFLIGRQRLQVLLASDRSCALPAGTLLGLALRCELLSLGTVGLSGLQQLSHRAATGNSFAALRVLRTETSHQLSPEVRVITDHSLNQQRVLLRRWELLNPTGQIRPRPSVRCRAPADRGRDRK